MLLIDIGFALFATFVAVAIALQLHPGKLSQFAVFGTGILILRVASFLYRKTYIGIVRYTGTFDVWRIFGTLTLGELIILAANAALIFTVRMWSVPFHFLWIEYSVLLLLMVFSRLIFKLLFVHNIRRSDRVAQVLIYGHSLYLVPMKNLIHNSHNPSFRVLGFIGTDRRSAGKMLAGIPVYSPGDLEGLLDRESVDSVIVVGKFWVSGEKKALMDSCMARRVTVKEIPRPEDLISGKMSINQLRDLNIADLLQREVIELDEENLVRSLRGRTVMVTGAAGSIGSEIVRQLARFSPGKIVLVDMAESPLYDLELELAEELKFTNFVVEMSNIRHRASMEALFESYRPQVVYHAAAYKHVPMIEKGPMEGIHTNILGTRIVADLADKYGCEKFVMVSTDKAVNPTNVMGCTKRIAEIYIQSLDKDSKTAFVTTRFGNVLGSNGSVVPRFMKQIEQGGPVTVTHPEITRFFMTIPEACQLVLQAGDLGEGGEIFVFDMGESVRIADLAKKMIRLAGLEEGKDIEIVYSGLRSGEKLYEEVLNEKEEVLPTMHSLIFRARVRKYDFTQVSAAIDRLVPLVEKQGGDKWEAVRLIKMIVPEFKSQNSEFDKIDEQLREVRI